MHQSTTPSLSHTFWARWASTQLLTLPIVQTLLPVTFGYSLNQRLLLWDNWGDKRGCDEVIDTLTQETSMGPSRSCWNGTSAMQPKEITSKGTIVSCVYVLSLNVPIRTNLETYLMILIIYIYIYIYIYCHPQTFVVLQLISGLEIH